MKKLKSYQYERYALLCQASYPKAFEHTRYGFSVDGQQQIFSHRERVSVRILWGEKREVVVVFRGSHNLSDWLANLTCLPIKQRASECHYWVHWGYSRLLDQPAYIAGQNPYQAVTGSVFERLIEVLQPLVDAGKRITLTGHSSGGAMAILAADQLERRYPTKVKRVVTFGQPGVGCHSFKRHYRLHQRTYRVCCDLDIVTFLPPIPGLYPHVGRMLWLHNNKIYENVSEHYRLLKTLSSWLMAPITYHGMGKYIRRKDFFDQH